MKAALRTAGLVCMGLALAAGLTFSMTSPYNGGWIVSLCLVLVGIALIKIAEAF